MYIGNLLRLTFVYSNLYLLRFNGREVYCMKYNGDYNHYPTTVINKFISISNTELNSFLDSIGSINPDGHNLYYK